uniref:Uncharacterized protein n=1 Tax=Mycena chlorophos TaxID=658473 RepID=A0ABQ0M5C1_MYCCL|nr:predicted protein [Mycena chlorophos]
MSSDSDNDEFLNDLHSQPPARSAAVAASSSTKKLTKKRRDAINNGTYLGPGRKSGETDFKGARKEVMDAHLAKYPRGTRHGPSHWGELFEAFDQRVSFRLAWDQEPPSDADKLARLNRPAEDEEQAFKAERDAFNRKKLRNFYNRAGSSTAGAKSVFKSVIKKLAVGDGPAPHRPATYSYYAKQPEYRPKVLAKFAQKYPEPDLLGGQRLNKFNQLAKKMFEKEPADVQDRVLSDLNKTHAQALVDYKSALTGNVLDGIMPEQQVRIRGRFLEVVAPLLDDLQRASGYEIAMHAGRVEVEDNEKPKLDFCSLFSGIGGDNVPDYKILRRSDPQTSTMMARGWGKHIFRVYQADNDLVMDIPDGSDVAANKPTPAQRSLPIPPPSTRRTSTRSHVTQDTSDEVARERVAGPSRAAAVEQESDDVEVTPEIKCRAILGAVAVYKQRLLDEYEQRADRHLLNPPPECQNPVLLDRHGQEQLGMALRGLDLYRLFDDTRYPRHEPIVGVEEFDDPPAICLAEYRNEIGPLTWAWICNPDLDTHERRQFVGRTSRMDPKALAEEEEKLEGSSCWARVKKAANKRRMLDVPSWGGADAADGLKKRKRGGGKEASDDDEYETDNADRKGKGKGQKRKTTAKKQKTTAKKPTKAPISSQVVDRPRPRPKKLAAKHVVVALAEEAQSQVEEPMDLEENAGDPMELEDEHDSLEAWVRKNPNRPNAVDKTGSVLLQAKLEKLKKDACEDDEDEGRRDESDVGGQESQVEQEPEREEGLVDLKQKRAAKTKAVTGLANLFEKYPASTSAGSATATKKKKKLMEHIPKSHDELKKHGGLEMVFKPILKNLDWAENAREWLLGLDGGGTEWRRMVTAWYEYEERFHFQEPDGVRPPYIFSTERRPEAVGIWIGVARPLKVIPVIKKLTTTAAVNNFGKSVRRWWYNINPSWRLADPKVRVVKTGEHKDWYTVFWPGPNGFLAVLACLYWWGSQMKDEPRHDEKWIATVQDVEWVIGNITRFLLANLSAAAEISDPSAFGEQLVAWWRDVNPVWRRAPDGSLDKAEGDYSALDVPGPNGFLTVLIGLKWWADRGGATSSGWTALMEDVDWCMTQLGESFAIETRQRPDALAGSG